MSDSPTKSDIPPVESIVIDLRNPWVAGFLAWLWPGAGHLYQRRYGKGLLFMGCILSLFVFGLILGEGQVVYAMYPPGQVRAEGGNLFNKITARVVSIAPPPFWLQAGVGLPAMPAVVQRFRVEKNQPPLFKGKMAPPSSSDELAIWQRSMGQNWDVGLLYTMIAGILNFFAIWDAAAGPAPSEPVGKKKDDEKKKPIEEKTPVTA